MSSNAEPGAESEVGIPRPGRARDPRVHQAILDATEKLIVELPYKAVTIEGIAEQAHVGKSTVYRWWPSKEDLVLEVVLDRWYQTEGAPSTGSVRGDLIEHVSRNAENHARGAGELILQVGLNATDPRSSPANRRIQEALERRRRIGRSILARSIAEGLLPEDADVELLLDILAGTALFRALKLQDPGHDIIEPLVDLVLGGECPRARSG